MVFSGVDCGSWCVYWGGGWGLCLCYVAWGCGMGWSFGRGGVFWSGGWGCFVMFFEVEDGACFEFWCRFLSGGCDLGWSVVRSVCSGVEGGAWC